MQEAKMTEQTVGLRKQSLENGREAIAKAPPTFRLQISGKVRKGKDERGEFQELDSATIDVFNSPMMARTIATLAGLDEQTDHKGIAELTSALSELVDRLDRLEQTVNANERRHRSR